MKRLFVFGGLLLSAFSINTSCTKENSQDIDINNGGVPFEIYADCETKTVNDGLSTNWEANDNLSVFHAVASSSTYVSDGEFIISDASTGKATGTLAEKLVEGNYDWYAFYPYTSAIKTPGSRTSGYVLIGSRSDSYQTQLGNDSMTHLAGSGCPLWGVATGVSYNETPAFAMHSLSSAIEFTVTNALDEPITVSEIIFEAPEDIVGAYAVDITGSNPKYDKYETYQSSSATLKVSDGTAIESGTSAKFYMLIKPFVASSEDKLKVSVKALTGSSINTKVREIDLSKETSFSAGRIKKVAVNFDENKGEVLPVYTLSFKQLETGTNYNSYTGVHSLTCDEIGWNVYGNQSMGDNLRVGGKNTTATNRTISSTSPISTEVGYVVINHDGLGTGKDSQIVVNSITIESSTSSSFSNSTSTIVNNPDLSTRGALSMNISAAAGSYIRITVNYQITGSNNCYLTINNIKFYPPRTLTSLAISGNPKNTAYYVGEAFDPSGLVVTATYDDNSTMDVTSNVEWNCNPESFSSNDTSCEVIASIGDISSEKYVVSGLSVTVPITLNSIVISGTPTKLTYVAGESLNTDGLVVTGHYSDGSSNVITDNITWTINPTTFTTSTTSCTVTATVGNITSDSFTVSGLTVNAPTWTTATMSAGTNGSSAKVNDKDAIKVGTSSKGGSMTIAVPAGATELRFYAAAWNGVTGLSLNITPASNVSTTSVSLTADTGIANSSPFTLAGSESEYLFTISLKNITSATTLTLTSSTTKRFVVWGAEYK